MAYFIDLRATAVGGFLADEPAVRRDSDLVRLDEVVQAVRGRHVLLVTHGYSVNREEGLEGLGCFSDLIGLQDSMFVGVLWPGDSSWAMGLDYSWEGDEAVRSGRKLASFLDQNFARTAGLSFASHSLGARVVLETIAHLALPVRQLVLMAGAIDDNCLTDEYRSVPPKVQRIAILSSEMDYILRWLFPLGNKFNWLIGDSDHPFWASALGYSGPRQPAQLLPKLHPRWAIPEVWDFGHHNYLGKRAENEPSLRYIAPMDLPGSFDPITLNPDGVPMDEETKPSWAASFVASRVNER